MAALEGQAAARQPVGAATASPVAPPPRFSNRDGYSLFVGWMKVLLPAFAFALIILLAAWQQFVPADLIAEGIEEFESLAEQADSLTMVNARYAGVDQNQQPFNLTAVKARQTSKDDPVIHLEGPQADITLTDGTWVTVSADVGVYDRDNESVVLEGGVNLFHDQGFEVHTELAQVDLKENKAWSDRAVRGQGPGGTIAAEGFQVLDRGAVVLFTGKSHALLIPGSSSKGLP